MKTIKQTRRTRRPRRATRPALRFSPYVWAKLLFLCDAGPTEVGGFGIAAEDDLLFVEDIGLVRQECAPTFVSFDDAAVADFFDEQVDQGLKPERFARIWVHTHPGDWPQPSAIDEKTFARCFGGADWAVMFILARGGQSYARLRFRAGPGGEIRLRVEVDFSRPFAAADHERWAEEHRHCVQDGFAQLEDAFERRPAARRGEFDGLAAWDPLGGWHDEYDLAFGAAGDASNG